MEKLDPPMSGDEDAAPDPAAVRSCSVCEVRLSRYNPGPNCWQHTLGWPWRGPTAKPKF